MHETQRAPPQGTFSAQRAKAGFGRFTSFRLLCQLRLVRSTPISGNIKRPQMLLLWAITGPCSRPQSHVCGIERVHHLRSPAQIRFFIEAVQKERLNRRDQQRFRQTQTAVNVVHHLLPCVATSQSFIEKARQFAGRPVSSRDRTREAPHPVVCVADRDSISRETPRALCIVGPVKERKRIGHLEMAEPELLDKRLPKGIRRRPIFTANQCRFAIAPPPPAAC
jgi:hypothetical protein